MTFNGFAYARIGKRARNRQDYTLDPQPFGPFLVTGDAPSLGGVARYSTRCSNCGAEAIVDSQRLRQARKRGQTVCSKCPKEE